MRKYKKNVTVSANPRQIAKVLASCMKAAAAVIGEFPVTELIKVFKGNHEKLRVLMKLLFTALLTNQVVVLQPESELELQPPSEFVTWRTVKIGTFKTARSLVRAMKKACCSFTNSAFNTIMKIELTKVETEIELVKISLADLGLKKGVSLQTIFARAFDLGFMLCPAEVGPQLRLQYPNENLGEELMIAMEGVSDLDGKSWWFYLYGVSLNAYYGNLKGVSDPEIVFVFARPSNK